MSRFFVLLICVIAVVVQGRPRLHHKHKQAHVQNPGSEDPRAHRRQPADHHPLSDAPAGPQDLSIFDVNVHKMADKNKVSGHIAPHSVAVSMQGPGTVSLSTTEQVVGPSEAKPDHTVSMVKDTGGCNGPECSMVNVKSGHQLPMALPLTGPSTPIQEPKEVKLHDLKPLAQASKEPAKLHGHAAADHGKMGHVVVHNQVNKKQANEIINGLETNIPVAAHKPKYEHPSLEENVKVHAAAERSDHGVVSHAHSHMTKEHANDMITGVQNGVPVVTHKPKKDVQVNNGHKVFIGNPGSPQKVFGQMDSNNVGVTSQGQGTVTVTSQFDIPQLSQTVVFDPMEPCSGPSCSPGAAKEKKGGKHH